MKSKELNIQIPIRELGELRFLQHTLLENLYLLSQLEDDNQTDRKVKDNMYWISKILLAITKIDQQQGFNDLGLIK
ncbi:hypothetical protein [Aquimarina muelleri]|uniref:Uncharacterized protein n=1 Tax=Aquimarina muelleri TaxID=279356 RepID=A0A918N579_9FLAO|nr:hypothetical protein [Aquimarina muelleri]MCX2762935.1 hypothetical protein [Aquimarina muelleri]GGX27340.1 hypothetical protein GCM10007384_30890 [Aquimarina muelleri]